MRAPRAKLVMSPNRGSWLSLLAMMMIFIGPLISQAMPMNHHASISMPMAMDMCSEMPAQAEHAAQSESAKPAADHPVMWEKCGYCSLLFSCPALPHTADLTLLAAPHTPTYLTTEIRLGHARQPVFPGARSRAPPAFR